MIQVSRLIKYFQECLKLLYWTYFKPFSLQKWLDNLEGNLKLSTPFLSLVKIDKYSKNPSTKSYISQVFFLTIFLPLIIFLLLASTVFSFNWLWNGLFFSSWLLSLLIAYKWLNLGCLVIFLIDLILLINFPYISLSIQTKLIPIIEGVFAGLLLVISGNIVFTPFFGMGAIIAGQLSETILKNQLVVGQEEINLALLIGAFSGLGLGLIWTTDLGLKSAIKRGIIWGVISGLLLGIIADISWGLLWTFSLISGILRVYFWLPAYLWISCCFYLNKIKKIPLTTFILPLYLDELIILPLPKIDLMITAHYFQNSQPLTETLEYLLNYTNQQKLALEILNKITLISLKQCRNIESIAIINEKLAWIIPLISPSDLTVTLTQLFRVSQAVRGFKGSLSADIKLEILNAAILVIEEIEQYLKLRKSAFAMACLPILKNWIAILETTQKELE